jgi:peptide/nickel transport system substrate-binding protein
MLDDYPSRIPDTRSTHHNEGVFMRMTRFAAASAVIVLAAGLAACSSATTPEEETTLRLGVGASSISFDPNFIYGGVSGNWHAFAVYDSLMYQPEGIGMPGDGGVEPRLAKEWSFNDDKTVLTMQLRDDAVFTDGTPVDAEAIKLNFDAWREQTEGILPTVKEVVVTGEYTLEVRQSEPFLMLFAFIGDLPVVAPAALEDRDLLAVQPVGSGPYLLDDYVTDSSYSFVRNPDYREPENFPFDRVEISLFSDTTAAVNALKSGQIDVTYVDAATAGEVEAAGFSTDSRSASWRGLYFGDRLGNISEPIGNLKVRQAISMAFDRVEFNETVDAGFGDPSNQIGVKDQPGFYVADRAEEYAYDIEAARELLAEAGYPDGFDIDIPNHPIWYLPYYAQVFEDLGIRVNWVPAGEDILEYLQSGKFAVLPYSAFIIDVNVLDPDEFAAQWGNTADAETRELLETINGGSDDEALAALEALNEKALDEAWFAVLSHPKAVVAFAPGLDVRLNTLTRIPLQSIGRAA